MADIFDTVSAPSAKSDIFDTVATDRQPSDANIGFDKFWAEHPYFKAAGDTLQQAFVNPISKAYNAITPVLDAGLKAKIASGEFPAEAFKSGSTPTVGPDMTNAPGAAKFLGDVASGATKGGMATVAGFGNPFLGFGALSGAEAYGKDQPVLPAVVGGVASAIPQVVAGKVGSTLATEGAKKFGQMFGQFAPQITKYAPNVGTSVGMGSANAAMAPDGEKLKAAAEGATFGAMSPNSPFGAPKQMTQEQYDAQVSKHGDIYRQILNPSGGEIRGLAKSGKTVDDAMNLAAKDKLIIDKDSGNKLDTTDARSKVLDSVNSLDDKLSEMLQSNPEKQFDLKQIGEEAKKNYRESTENDLEYENGAKHIDDQINAAIKNRGQYVDGATLNNIKRGMWQTSYNSGVPNSQDAARSVGFVTKNAIENAYAGDADIMGTNKQMGNYLTLDGILQKANGRIIQGGKLGKYFSRITGLVVGGAAGHATGVPGSEAAGAMIGNEVGGRLEGFANDPSRITESLSKKLGNINVTNPTPSNSTRPGVVTPEVVNPNQKQFSLNPFNVAITNQSASSPLGIPNIFSDRAGMPPVNDVIKQGSESAPGTIEGQKPEMPYSPGPESIVTPKVTEEAKQEAKDQTNKIWAKGMGIDLPSTAKKAAVIGGATALGAGMFGNQAQAQQNIDIKKINQIESSGDPSRIGDNGKAFGLNQIHAGTLSDYNKSNGTNFNTDNLMNPDTNNKVADWYYNVAAPKFLKANKIPDTIENRISFYNEGQGNLRKRIKSGGAMPEITKRYIQKYKALK